MGNTTSETRCNTLITNAEKLNHSFFKECVHEGHLYNTNLGLGYVTYTKESHRRILTKREYKVCSQMVDLLATYRTSMEDIHNSLPYGSHIRDQNVDAIHSIHSSLELWEKK